MKRAVLVFALVVGSLVAGATNASAATYCSLDPTLKVGVPLVKLGLNVNLLGSKVYASTNGSSTTFGGGLLLP